METELTKRIKSLTHEYSPKLNSKMRTIRWADEVWTPTGVVDSIRFEDYYSNEEYLCHLIDAERYSKKENAIYERSHKLGECFRDGSKSKDDKKCHGCVFRNRVYDVGMMITCFEVKITYNDFKSDNGHNFHGNENYYCVPKELASKIVNEVPDHVGILSYWESDKGYGLRLYKPAKWQDVDNEKKVMLLYNAMKKWCDGAVFPDKKERY